MSPTQFFLQHAGLSYRPEVETEREGRLRCARALAKAEAAARDLQLDFEWFEDCVDADFSGERPWVCLCLSGTREIMASLSGIDFGRGGSPWGQPHKRVVEAELALEAINQ